VYVRLKLSCYGSEKIFEIYWRENIFEIYWRVTHSLEQLLNRMFHLVSELAMASYVRT